MPSTILDQEEVVEGYGARTTEDIRLELRYQGQSSDGDREEMIKRLEKLKTTHQGRRDDYERRHAAWDKAKLEATKPLFPLFTNLPAEIQTQIWELSLPGPRLICPSRLPGNDYYLGDRDEGTWPHSYSDSEEDEDEDEDEDDKGDDEENDEDDDRDGSENEGGGGGGGDQEDKMGEDTSETEAQYDQNADVDDGMLIKRNWETDLKPHLLTRDFRWMVFHNTHMSLNPAALFVCQLSRDIAKIRYRPCFGRAFLYIDLEIDILYFGPWCYPMWNHLLHWMNRWDFYLSENPAIPPATYTDMQLVQRIALEFKDGYEFYDAENCEHLTPDMTGKNLRKQVARFPAVKELILCEIPDLDVHNFRAWESNVEPHQMTLAERPQRAIPRHLCGSQAEESACNIAHAFMEGVFKDDEESKGVPDVMFARLGLVGYGPSLGVFKEDPYGID